MDNSSQGLEVFLIEDKKVKWLGDSRKVIKSFPSDIKMDLGADLFRLQKGLQPNSWKPFPGLKRNAFVLIAKYSSGICGVSIELYPPPLLKITFMSYTAFKRKVPKHLEKT